LKSALENLNGHEAENGKYGQGNPYGNSPFLDPTASTSPVLHHTTDNRIMQPKVVGHFPLAVTMPQTGFTNSAIPYFPALKSCPEKPLHFEEAG